MGGAVQVAADANVTRPACTTLQMALATHGAACNAGYAHTSAYATTWTDAKLPIGEHKMELRFCEIPIHAHECVYADGACPSSGNFALAWLRCTNTDRARVPAPTPTQPSARHEHFDELMQSLLPA